MSMLKLISLNPAANYFHLLFLTVTKKQAGFSVILSSKGFHLKETSFSGIKKCDGLPFRHKHSYNHTSQTSYKLANENINKARIEKTAKMWLYDSDLY